MLLFLMFAISLWLVHTYPYLLKGFLGGATANVVLNYALKALTRESRPHLSPNEAFYGAQKYGMPSGHAQTAFFFAAFVYFATANLPAAGLLLCLSAACLMQRYMNHYHTAMQLIAGSVVGVLMAYWAVHIARTQRARQDSG